MKLTAPDVCVGCGYLKVECECCIPLPEADFEAEEEMEYRCRCSEHKVMPEVPPASAEPDEKQLKLDLRLRRSLQLKDQRQGMQVECSPSTWFKTAI